MINILKNKMNIFLNDESNEEKEHEAIIEQIKTFKDDRVWVTKKARMEAEARMNRNNMLSLLLVNYYVFGVLAFSIWTLVSDDESLSILTVIASVGLFGLSIFVSTISFREKALQFKESYLNLNELEFDLDNLLQNKDYSNDDLNKELNKFGKKYTDILTKSENHNDIDYIKVKLKHDDRVSPSDLLKYYFWKISIYILILGLFVFPILLILIFRR